MAIFKRKKKEEPEKTSTTTVTTSTTYSGPVKEGTSESLYRATGITASAGVGTSGSSTPSSIPTSAPTTSGIGKPSSGGSKRVTPTTTKELTGKVEVIGDTGVEETRYYIEGEETGRTFTRDDKTYAESSGGKNVKQTFTFDTGGKREVVDLGGLTGGARISEYEMITGGTRGGITEFVGTIPSDLLGTGMVYGSSKMDFGKIDGMQEAYLPGTIYTYQTREFKGTPIMETRVVQPFGESIMATREEQLRVNPIVLEIGEGRKTEFGKVFGETKGRLGKFGEQEYGAGVYFEKEIREWSEKGGKARQMVGGVVTGIIPTTKGEFIKTGVEFGIGAGIGAGIKGAGIALGAIPKVGKYVAPTFKIGTYGVGGVMTGAYVSSTASQVYFTEDYYSKGEIIGGGLREFAAIGGGFGVGTKAAEKAYGLWRTRGRGELPLERLTRPEVIEGTKSFPTAPSETHLKLFKETSMKVPELAQGTPGGFHVTPEKFFGKGRDITPQAGTSEFPGLYVSSEPSIHFAGINGKGYSLKLPSLKSITTSEKPAIAFLKPRGFREVGFREVTPYKIGEQEFKYVFKKPAKEGFIDIPKMKTEIEGIARIEAGGYGFESAQYYTTIRGVRTPIDVFKAKGGKVEVRLQEGKAGKGFSSEEYGGLPERTSLSDLRSSLGKIRSSYSKTSSSYFQPLSSASSSYLSSTKSSRRISSSYIPRRRGYSSRSILGGSSTGISYSSLSSYTPSSKPPMFKLPIAELGERKSLIRGERLFIETPTLGAVLGKEFGIEFKTTGLGGYSGLGERQYKTGIKLPTTILKTVQRKEFKI